jgi:hypothetical protein
LNGKAIGKDLEGSVYDLKKIISCFLYGGTERKLGKSVGVCGIFLQHLIVVRLYPLAL